MMPMYWCRTCGPFTLNLERMRTGVWRLDLVADPMVFHTAVTADGTNLTMAQAKAWATAHVQMLFQGWLTQAESIEWRD